MDKEIKDFLNYGVETAVITRKGIIEQDALILFFSLINMLLSGFSIPMCVINILVFLGCSILTFSRQSVTGEKYFFIVGIWSVSFGIVLGIAGTLLVLLTIEKQYHFRFGIIIFVIYLLVITLFAGMILRLIKRGAYSQVKKTTGGVGFTLFGAAGISVARLLSKGMGNEVAIQCGGICFYLVSFLMVSFGFLGLVKYYFLKKLREAEVD